MSRSTNPFENDDDDAGYSSRRNNYTNHVSETGGRREQLKFLVDESEDRQLASSKRALASLYDSEQIGRTTAEELVHQGEQLDNIERKTHEINKNVSMTQKHLNNIKSVFGGIKTWWAGPPKVTEEDTVPTRERPLDTNSLRTSRVESDTKYGTRSTADDLDSRFLSGSNRSQTSSQYSGIKKITKSEKEAELDETLGMMSDGLSGLRSLALNMGKEISQQNDQIDRINTITVRTTDNIGDKNKQMFKILKK